MIGCAVVGSLECLGRRVSASLCVVGVCVKYGGFFLYHG